MTLHYTSRSDQLDRLYNGVLNIPSGYNGKNEECRVKEEQSISIELTS